MSLGQVSVSLARVFECGQVSGCPVHGPSQSTELASWSAAR